MQRFAVVLLTILGLHLNARAQYTYVPLRHQVYPLLIKGETLGLFSDYALRTLPLDRDTVLRLLRRMQEQSARMSDADRRLLQQMLAEFTDPPPDRDAPPGSEIHALRYRDGDQQLFLDVTLRQSFRFSRNRLEIDREDLSETDLRIAVRGNLGEHLFYAAEAVNALILGSENLEERFDPALGRIQVTVGQSIFTDQAIGYFAYRRGRFTTVFGRQKISWGAALADRLGLSAGNEPMDMLRLQFDFSRFRYASFHANLQGLGSPRYLAGHRIDWLVHPRMQIGAYETLVYGGRNIELAYLNPLLPFHIMEHQLGDRDNNMVGFDLTAFPTDGLRITLEIFVDDFSLDYPLGTYWGNKLAYHFGVHWVAPFGVRPLELSTDYTRVDPFVYTHYDTLNIYAHYGRSIGSQLGPNADRWQWHLAWQPRRDVRWQLGYAYIRQGRGDIMVAHRPEDGIYKGFLRGLVERQHRVWQSLRVQVLRDIFVRFDVLLKYRRNAGRQPGENRLERFGHFALEINY
ncbi:MAG: capsule assembly Wzi family protein [candidate division KSB1 bacterium]|nr:capsule assembly Wzi family protein [candidate division KSB1 bacterium]MDQ7063076.1 capsule assembly Wzi family protein [candidate division KSB1 bacterium]